MAYRVWMCEKPMPPSTVLTPRVARLETLTNGDQRNRRRRRLRRSNAVCASSLRPYRLSFPDNVQYSYKLAGSGYAVVESADNEPNRHVLEHPSGVITSSHVRARLPGYEWHNAAAPHPLHDASVLLAASADDRRRGGRHACDDLAARNQPHSENP